MQTEMTLKEFYEIYEATLLCPRCGEVIYLEESTHCYECGRRITTLDVSREAMQE